MAQTEGQILLRRDDRNIEKQTNKIKGIKIVVTSSFEEAIEADTLTIVHIPLRFKHWNSQVLFKYYTVVTHLGRIIAKDAIYEYYFFPLGKPSIWPKPGFRLRGTRRHVEERCDTNEHCQETSEYR